MSAFNIEPLKTLSRRRLLAASGAVALGTAVLGCPSRDNSQSMLHHRSSRSPPQTADEVLQWLVDGNHCYISEHFDVANARRSDARRHEVAVAQKPFATILGCSDSRVSPELLFSSGLGELFVVRVAGNIVDDRCFGVLGSLEYAVEELGIPLMLVLGHEECGAVKAAIRAVQEGTSPKGALGSIVDALRPAVESLTDRNPEDLVREVVKANVERSVNHLLKSHVALADAVAEARVKIVGGIYELHTGRVQMLGGIAS